MADLKVPSLQHLARNWREEAERTARILVRLALNPPRFNYDPLFAAVIDIFIWKVPYATVEDAIKTRVKRASVRDNLLEVLPLIRDHFEGLSPDFFQLVDRRYYSVGRGLMVPFQPPMIYGIGGQLYFPWFSFWRQNPLAKERLSLFVTMVDELLMDDPDLETARFQILDFSMREGKRTLLVTDANEIPRVDDARKAEMLTVFAEACFKALDELKGHKRPAEERPVEQPDPRQDDLFDWPPEPK